MGKEKSKENPNKLLTRIAEQINAGNNSYKLKNETRKLLSLLYQHIKVTKNFITI